MPSPPALIASWLVTSTEPELAAAIEAPAWLLALACNTPSSCTSSAWGCRIRSPSPAAGVGARETVLVSELL